MPKARLIRLVIYLIVALLLIVLLWVMSKNSEPKQKEEKKVEEGIPVDLPSDNESLKQGPHLDIEIDSNNVYYLKDLMIEWNELVDSITVQQEKEPKLSILLSVHYKTKSGEVARVLEIAKEKNMRVGISTKND